MSPNSCPSDDTVTIFENAKDSRSTFKFHSFRFQRLDKSSTVWLHCEVQVCDSDRLPCRPVSLLPIHPKFLLLFSLYHCPRTQHCGSELVLSCFPDLRFLLQFVGKMLFRLYEVWAAGPRVATGGIAILSVMCAVLSNNTCCVCTLTSSSGSLRLQEGVIRGRAKRGRPHLRVPPSRYSAVHQWEDHCLVFHILTLNFLICPQLAVGPAGGTVQVNTIQVNAGVLVHVVAVSTWTGRDSLVCAAGLQLSVAMLLLLGNTCWDWLNALAMPRHLSHQHHLHFM